MKTWILSKSLSQCPLGWQNFIIDLQNRIDKPESDDFSIAVLNQELAPYKAHIREVINQVAVVDFRDEVRYTLFTLKYGGKS